MTKFYFSAAKKEINFIQISKNKPVKFFLVAIFAILSVSANAGSSIRNNNQSANTLMIRNVLDTTPACTLTAKFGINSLIQCITDNKFVFTDSTTGGNGVLSYYWDFNDGTSSTEKNPVHIYGKPSDHDIALTVKDSYGCSSGYLLQVTVGPVPTIGFMVTPYTVDGHYLTFNDTSRVASGWLNYSWDFGDNTTSTLANPAKSYAVAGDYKVTTHIVASGGCKASLTKIVNSVTGLITPCTARVGLISGEHTLCLGTTTQLSDTTANGVWSSSDATIAKVSESGLVTGLSAGSVIISYGVVNSCGIAYQTTGVTINTLPVVSGIINNNKTISKGSIVQLSDNTSYGVWSSANVDVATVSVTGQVKGISAGVDSIFYSVSNICGTTYVATAITVINLAPITGPTSVCKGASITLSDSVAGGKWTVSDSTIATIQVIKADSTQAKLTGLVKGTVNISYTLDSDTVYYAVAINSVPGKPSISGPDSVATGATIQLTGNPTNGIWNSVHTNLATVNSAGIVTGIKVGIDTLSYEVSNDCGVDSIQYVVTIINPKPVCALTAKFGINSLIQCITDNKFVFTDSTKSGIGAVSYYWDFNDGTSSTEQNPVHIYGKPADHPIALTVKDSFGCSSGYLLSVTVGPVPAIGFKVTPKTVDGHYLTFNDTSRVASGWLNYTWDFGDNTGSTLSNPSKLYATPGVYDVTLNIAASGGCKASLMKRVNSETGDLIDCTPKVGEVTGARNICLGTTIQLSDTTANGVWSSLDATIAKVSESGLVTGLSAGNTTISYGVTNSCGVATQSAVVVVKTKPVVDNMSTGIYKVNVNSTVQLINNTYNLVWSSSNNNVATVTATGLVKGIAEGMDTITYSASNSCGTAQSTVAIKVSNLPPITGPTSLCKGSSVTLAETLAGGTWGVSDNTIASVTVIAKDSTQAKLTGLSNGPGGPVTISYTVDSSTVYYTVTVNSAPTKLAAISGPDSVAIGSTIQLSSGTPAGIWSSLNTTLATIDANGLVTGIKVGADTIAYSVSNTCGSASIQYAVTITKATPVCNLIAKFSINKLVQCITDNKFVFTNLSTGAIGAVSYLWDFNDGTSSTEKNPVHIYSKPSDHDISLTVKDSFGCSQGYLLQITVGPVPVVGFSVTSNTVNGEYYTFDNESTVASGWLNYKWNFGDGNTSTLVTPSNIYSTSGTYCVKLAVVASGGCTNSITKKLEVKNEFKVSNNPTSTTTTVTYKPNSSYSVISIMNEATGVVVKIKKIATIAGSLTNSTIDLTGLSKGTYAITIKNAYGIVIGTARVVKL